MKFKKGDIVRCVRNRVGEHELNIGTEYAIDSVCEYVPQLIYLIGEPRKSHYSDRFVLVTKENEKHHNLEVGDRVMWNGKTVNEMHQLRLGYNVAGLDMTKTYTVDAIFPNSVSLKELPAYKYGFYNWHVLECKLKHAQGNDYQVKINY